MDFLLADICGCLGGGEHGPWNSQYHVNFKVKLFSATFEIHLEVITK